MYLAIGHTVHVIDQGGNIVTTDVITDSCPTHDTPPCDQPLMELEVDGKWYPEYQVHCACCGSDMICPQCAAEADLSGMLYA